MFFYPLVRLLSTIGWPGWMKTRKKQKPEKHFTTFHSKLSLFLLIVFHRSIRVRRGRRARPLAFL